MPFHTKTFALLRHEPVIREWLSAQLDSIESRLEMRLPAAVRDWYLREGALKILAKNSNSDEPIAAENFAAVKKGRDFVIPFKNENQGVCRWAFALDGSDDSPVYVDMDDDNTEPWQLNSRRFSEHVLAGVWDYQIVLDRAALVEGQMPPLEEETVQRLKGAFESEISTFGWPGGQQFRFRKGVTGVLIWASRDQADWFLGSDDEESLAATIIALSDCAGLRDRLYGCSELGRAALDIARQREH